MRTEILPNEIVSKNSIFYWLIVNLKFYLGFYSNYFILYIIVFSNRYTLENSNMTIIFIIFFVHSLNTGCY